MNENLTKLEQVALAALQGLLASGHYTYVASDGPKPREFELGDDRKANGHSRSRRSNAASDAFVIARDFLKESNGSADDASIDQKA